jgi:tetratricopeptide (TPR) repeat protein
LQLLLGRLDEAATHFEQAATQNPDADEAHWGQIECWLAQGEVLRAIREVQQLNARPAEHAPGALQPVLPSERPDGWVLAALGAEAGGMIDNMAVFLEKAQQSLPVGFIAPHRRERYYDALAALSIYRGEPSEVPGPIGQVAAFMRGSFDAVPGARVRPLDSAMVQRIVRHLLLAGRNDVVLPLAEAQADAVLPGIAAEVETALSSLS